MGGERIRRERTATMSNHPGRWWHLLDDGRIQCDLCPRDCRLHEGQRGACFVRQREGDAMVLTTYGRSSGFCIDPIEKKPLNHFYPGSSVFSFGTAGCNLACKFCQNWDISKSREMDTLMDAASPAAIAEAAAKSQLQERRLHLQRSGHLRRVCDGHRGRLPCARDQDGCRHRRLHRRRRAPRVLREDGRRQRRPQGLHRRVLREALRRASAAGARHARLSETRDRRLVRDHDAADPGQERLRGRARGHVRLDRARAGHRGADPFHRVPSGLQDDGPAAHAGHDAHAGARHRAARGHPLRLHRQRARPHRRDDLLRRVRQAAHRPRLARDPELRPDGRRRTAGIATRSFRGISPPPTAIGAGAGYRCGWR